MMDDTPLYNSRIIKSYVEYVKKYFPDIDIDRLLKYANIENYQIDDEGHWFTQEQSDHFHDILVTTTKDPEIPIKVGRFSAMSRASGTFAQYLLGFIDPATAYSVLNKLSARLSRATVFQTRLLGPERLEARTEVLPGVIEKPYQCLYRMGVLGSLSKFYTKKLATIEHPVCIHKGGDCCLYVISWEKTLTLLWKRIRNYSFIIGFVICAISLSLIQPAYWDVLVLSYVLFSVGMTLYVELLEKKELLSNFHNQGDAAERLLDQINWRYNESMLIQEIGQNASLIPEVDEFLKYTMKSLVTRLDFDRGMIMLANKQKDCLVYAAGYGYNPKNEDYMKNVKFHLDNPHSKGVAVDTFKKQKPVLITDLAAVEKDLSPRSLDFIRDMGIQSFICIPIVYKGESMGILMVDNVQSKKQLGQTEMNLLMGIAPEIGISINNAVSYQKIKESEERYRTIFESTATSNIIVAEDSTIIMANNNFANLCGYTKQELEGKMSWTVFIHKDDLEKMKTYYEISTHDHGSTPSSFEFRAINRQGKVLNLFMSAAVIPETKESVISMVNLTERKQLESQFIQAQKMESVGQLAGGVAHDFNNMLSVIIGNTEMAMSKVNPSEPLHKSLQDILNAGLRSADLTHQLLAFARKQTVAPKVIDLNETVEGMLKMLRRIIGEDIDLAWLPSTSLWPVKMDPSQIDQILVNLCVNSRHAIAGVGKVTIETGTTVFDETYCSYHMGSTPGDYVLLAVSDNGCGMNKETLANIFEPFFTTKELGQGTGLGLSTVYGIVKQNDGFINVYSNPGHGTTFRIYLPRHVGKTEQIQDENMAPPPPRGNEIVLLVEDELAIKEMTSKMLESLGYTVLTASAPDEAIRLAEKHSSEINLLLTDVIMPDMNGRDLAKNMLSLHPDIKHLFMSGYTAKVIAHQGVLDEGVHFLQKPFSVKSLATKVREALG